MTNRESVRLMPASLGTPVPWRTLSSSGLRVDSSLELIGRGTFGFSAWTTCCVRGEDLSIEPEFRNPNCRIPKESRNPKAERRPVPLTDKRFHCISPEGTADVRAYDGVEVQPSLRDSPSHPSHPALKRRAIFGSPSGRRKMSKLQGHLKDGLRMLRLLNQVTRRASSQYRKTSTLPCLKTCCGP
jgi:hypothetical protein